MPPTAAPRLVWTEIPNPPSTVELRKDRTLIGRRADADVVLRHGLASRRHAEILKENETWVLVDLKSTHGTFVDGERIERRSLKPGDRIRLGQEGVELQFVVGANTDAAQSTSLFETEGLDLSVSRLVSVLPEQDGAHSELEKISCLLDFHYSFGKAFSPEKTFLHILKSALQISGAERGFVLRNEKGDFAYALGLDSQGRTLNEADFRTSHSVVDRVTTTREPVFMTQGIEADLAAQASIVALSLRAVACLPLEAIAQSTGTAAVMGILYLDSRKRMHSLSGLDEKLLTRLAGEAGHVLEKLELVETLAERQRLEQELAVAEETQQTLLPQSLPRYEPYIIRSFCRATRQLGGDFYDFITLANGQLVGLLADVSGKGIPAALLSSFTLGALNMEFRLSAEPDKVLSGVNKLLCQKTPLNRFVTLFLFQVDATGHGQFISAGHNTCFLFRAATDKLEDLESGGVPLGLLAPATYRSSPLRLDPGDVLVIYSDGLTDAENGAGEEFGEERLRELILSTSRRGAGALEAALLAALDGFTQGAAQTDDITFLVIENGASRNS